MGFVRMGICKGAIPIDDCMMFPKTLDEFIRKYQLRDNKEIYTNGAMLLPVFRLKQWIEVADVRPVVRGQWVPVSNDDEDEGIYKCSICGNENYFPELLIEIPADNFCSNCGADMRPKEEPDKMIYVPPEERSGVDD